MEHNSYNEKRQILSNKIDEIISLCEKYNDERNISRLYSLKNAMNNDRFELLVVGEFSRGKSTLVNALLGSSILPSDPNPTTTMLNVIRNGDKVPTYRIHYKNGEFEDIDQKKFESMVASGSREKKTQDTIQEAYNEAVENAKIEYAEICVENDFGKLGIEIVDTPGINDINITRELITLERLGRADAAIVVASALTPLEKTEYEFITGDLLRNNITKLFVAVNYADCIKTENDRKKVLNVFETRLAGIVPKERIFFVSSKNALKYKKQLAGQTFSHPIATYEETGFQDFSTNMLEYLSKERGDIKLEKHCNDLSNIIDEILHGTIDLRRQACAMSKEDLEHQISNMKERSRILENQYRNELEKVTVDLLKERSSFAADYEKRLKNIGDSSMTIVNQYHGIDIYELHEKITDNVIKQKQSIQTEFLSEMMKKVEDIIESHTAQFGDEFAEIGIPVNPLLLKFQNDGQELKLYDTQTMIEMNKPKPTQEDIVESALIGAAVVGVSLLAVTVMITNPAIFLGAYVAGKVLVGNENNENESVKQTEPQPQKPAISNEMICNVYRADVKKCYIDSISGEMSRFKNEYEKSIRTMIDSLREDCEKQMDHHKMQLELELNEKENEQSQIRNRIEEFRKDSVNLTELKLWCGGFV